MIMIWYVALGSAAGGVARFLLGGFVQRAAGTTFPVGTLLINITGSILLGFLLRYALATPAVSPEMRALLTTGFCGGYTTFSTFSYETATLLEDGDHRRALVYIVLSVGISLVGTLAGFAAASRLLALRSGA
ncbi:MAG TPA: fluoride efflux transporter CrcB [Gemmatimonadaceae bacterium]|nr:fluoride efflux transporter CrcB [Gemmatimonadaceae bacterium]